MHIPSLEITAADLDTPDRLAMTRAYLTGLMLWPDDPDRQGEAVAVAAALRLSVGANPEFGARSQRARAPEPNP